MTMRDEWENPDHPPTDPATDLGGGVWVSWTGSFNEPNEPLIWHWCTQSKWLAQGRPWARPGWLPAGVKGHELLSRDPLHLEPSLLWDDCCGMHGWIREGRWSNA